MSLVVEKTDLFLRPHSVIQEFTIRLLLKEVTKDPPPSSSQVLLTLDTKEEDIERTIQRFSMLVCKRRDELITNMPSKFNNSQIVDVDTDVIRVRDDNKAIKQIPMTLHRLNQLLVTRR